MARSIPIGFDTHVTLRADELSAYLCGGGIGDPLTGREDRGQPLLHFDKCVLMLARSESSIISRTAASGMVYGSTVRIICPATQTVAVVVKHESSSPGNPSAPFVSPSAVTLDGGGAPVTTQGSSFRIVMKPQEQAMHNSTFRIIQKMNSRTSGDLVMNGDNVVLLLEGSDLYVGGREGPGGKTSIVASIEPCTWSLRAYHMGYCASSGFLFAGRAVSLEYRLHHAFLSSGDLTQRPIKETGDSRATWVSNSHDDNGYVSAPSPAVNVADGHELPDVFFERLDPNVGRQAVSSRLLCSAKSLWCFEAADPSVGGPMRVGDPYRLRHLASGRYLSVSEDIAGVRASIKMLRVDDPAVMEQATFELDASAEDESGHMSSSHSFVRLKHIATGQWLSCGILENTPNVLAVLAFPRGSARDRFSIRHPHVRVNYTALFVTTNLAVLRDFVDYFLELHRTPLSLDRILRDEATKLLLDRVIVALSSIRAFCCSQRRIVTCGADLTFEPLLAKTFPLPQHQRMLLDMQAERSLIECMVAPFRGLGSSLAPPLVDGVFPMTHSMASKKEFRAVAAIALDLLRLLATGSESNANSICSYIPLLVYLDRFGWDCAPTIRTVLEHTRSLTGELQSQIALDLLALNAVNPRDCYLKCVAELPLASVAVVEYMSKHPGEFATIIASSRGQRLEVSTPTRRTDSDSSLGERAVSGGVNMAFDVLLSHGSIEDLKYFAATLKLLFCMVDTTRNGKERFARPSNPDAVEYVSKVFSRDRLIVLLQSSFREGAAGTSTAGIGDALRAMLLKLAMKLYVQKDVDDLAVPKTFVIAKQLPAVRMTDAFTDGSFIRHVKISALEVLKGSTRQVTDQIGRNRLVGECVEIWTLLLRYNLAARSEVDELLPIVLGLLDGRKDVQSVATTSDPRWNRYELTRENSILTATKVNICHLVEAYVESMIHGALTLVSGEMTSATDVAALCEMAATALAKSMELLRSDDTTSLLLDLTLYESKELTQAAVSVLTRIGTVFTTFANNVTMLRVLHPSHNADYISLIRTVTSIQLKCRTQKSITKDISKLIASLRSLLGRETNRGGNHQHEDELVLSASSNPVSPTHLEDEFPSVEGGEKYSSVFLDFLALLRLWNLHTAVLSWQPCSSDEVEALLDFLLFFVSNAENVSSVSSSWQRIFRILHERPEHQRKALSVLEKLWSGMGGGEHCAVRLGEIREVGRIFAQHQHVEALRALVAVASRGATPPAMQLEMFSLLQAAAVFVEGWFVSLPQQVVLQLMTLVVICSAGNPSVQAAAQKILSARTAMLLVESSSRREMPFKILLVKFIVEVHLCPLDETGGASDAEFVKQQWCADELWWRLVRGDFLVVLDEFLISTRGRGTSASASLTTSTASSQRSLRSYAMEALVAMRVYFTTRFVMGFAIRLEWLLKDVRLVTTSISHLIMMVSSLSLSVNEVSTITLLARSILDAVETWTDPTVAKLQDALKTLTSSSFFECSKEQLSGGSFTPSRVRGIADIRSLFGSGSKGGDDTASPGGSVSKAGLTSDILRERLDALIIRITAVAEKEDAKAMSCVVEHIRPKMLEDTLCVERKIITKMMTVVSLQDFTPEGNKFVLQALNQYASSGSNEEERFQLQSLLGEQAVLTTTFLVDASDPLVVRAALDLGTAILDGGNTKVQNEFLRYFAAVDEGFFLSLKRTLDDASLEVQHYRRSQTSQVPFRLFQDGVAFSCCRKFLRVLQLLCEGHNFKLQEYCREQTDNARSVSVPQITVAFLAVLVDGTVDAFESVILQCFNLLTELCQGPCSGNQNLLISSELVSVIDKVLRQEMVAATVKAAAITTLIALVEGCTDQHVAEMVMRQLHMNTIIALFDTRREDEASMELIFELGIFLHCMQDLLVGHSLHFPISQLLQKRPDIVKQTGKIQIQRDDMLERVYFRIPAVCRRIRDESKLRLLWDVDRSSQAAKHSSFYDVSESLIVELDLVSSFEALVQKVVDQYGMGKAIRSFFSPSVAEWVIVSCAIAAVANLLLLLDLVSEHSWLYFPLALTEVFVGIILLGLDVGISAPVSIHRRMKQMMRAGESGGNGGSSSISGKSSGDSSNRDNDDRNNNNNNEIVIFDNLKSREQLMQTVARPEFLFFLLLLLCSLISCAFGPKWLVIHLFGGISLSPALKNVIAAVTLNKRTLGLTVLLAFLCCYSFTLVGHSMFPDDFDGHCRTLLECFIHIVTVGFRQGGGIGEVMTPSEWASPTFVPRRMFDFSFWVVMIIIFLNIIFGIIIDTFAELRDAKQAKESDMRHKCFVCGIDSHVFDRHGDGFISHTKYEHNMWQYLYFIHHLRLKNPDDYTGQESFVAHHLLRKDFSFFPTRSFALEQKTKMTESASRVNQAYQKQIRTAPSARRGHERAPGDNSGGAAALVRQLLSVESEIKSQSEDIKQSLRRLSSRQSATVNYSVSTAGAARQACEVATQTTMSESLVAFQFDAEKLREENRSLAAESARLKREMRMQSDEVWRLQLQLESQQQTSMQVTLLERNVKESQRQADLATAEKEAILRHNAFLQKELDALVLENTKLSAFNRNEETRQLVAESEVFGSASHTLRHLLDRSKAYEALEIDDIPASLN
jgi:hypothetical protein